MSTSSENPTGEVIKAGVEVIKIAYDDAVQPLAKQTGRALETVGRTVNAALAPLRGLVWGWEQIEDFISNSVEKKLKERGVPKERIKTPDPDVAVPAFEAIRYSKLRENYANLIATSMDTATADIAHPAFVEILKQLTPDEAKILAFLPEHRRYEPLADLAYTLPQKGQFMLVRNLSNIGTDAGCEKPELAPNLIDNICRLGLAEIPPMRKLTEDSRYDRIRSIPLVEAVKSTLPEEATFDFERRMVGLTLVGDAFRRACIDGIE